MSNLHTTEFHTVTTGNIVDQRGEESMGYVVTNTKTGIVEFECFNLVEAVDFTAHMEPRLAAFYGDKDEEIVFHS